MEFMVMFASIAGALFLYSVGAVAGFVYSCSRKGRTWNDVGRILWDSLQEYQNQDHKPKLHLIRRAIK